MKSEHHCYLKIGVPCQCYSDIAYDHVQYSDTVKGPKQCHLNPQAQTLKLSPVRPVVACGKLVRLLCPVKQGLRVRLVCCPECDGGCKQEQKQQQEQQQKLERGKSCSLNHKKQN